MVLNKKQTQNSTISTEVAFINRVEFPYRLKFYDLMTKYTVKIDEDSVNCVVYELDSVKANRVFVVACDYVEKKN